MTPYPCLICGVTPQTDRHSIMYRALTFRAYGAYGSNYDPMTDRKYLMVIICDTCVERGALAGRVCEAAVTPVPDNITYEPYKPAAQQTSEQQIPTREHPQINHLPR